MMMLNADDNDDDDDDDDYEGSEYEMRSMIVKLSVLYICMFCEQQQVAEGGGEMSRINMK